MRLLTKARSLARARVWNATPYEIRVIFTDYAWDLWSRSWKATTHEVRIAALASYDHDNISSALDVSIPAYGLSCERIAWYQSWQYIVEPSVSDCAITAALSQPLNLLSLEPAKAMNESRSGAYLASWMTDSAGIIGNRPIWDTVLPGTHDSGSFSWLNTEPVRNQTLDIGGQLTGGARYLDFRVKQRADGTYVMAHGSYPPGDAQNLDAAFEQLLAFLSDNPGEVVVIRMEGKDLGADHAYVELQDHCIDKLRERLIVLEVPKSTQAADPADYTYAACIARRQNVVLIGMNRHKPSLAPPAPTRGGLAHWQWKTGYLDVNSVAISDSWDCKQTYRAFCDLTPQQKIDFIKDHIPKWLKGLENGNVTPGRCGSGKNPVKDQQHVDNYFNCAAATIWTLNTVADTINLLQGDLVEWTSAWAVDAEVVAKLNIVYLDAVWSSSGIFPVNTALVPSIIALNKAKPARAGQDL